MSKDLVKQLKGCADYAISDYLNWEDGYEVMLEAAQRIEDLEAKLEELYSDLRAADRLCKDLSRLKYKLS